MFDLLLSGPHMVFTVALALLFGLLALELVVALLGGTLLGAGGAGLDAPDLDAPDLGDLDIDFDGIDAEALDLAGFDAPETSAPGSAQAVGIAGWLGFGRMPVMIWMGSVLFAFGASGFALQGLFAALTGGPLPGPVAPLTAGAFALWFARAFGGFFVRLLPRSETQSVSANHLGRRMGVVTQGTAARGRPAEVKVSDRFGNPHYLRAEPLRDDTEIAQGAQVIVLRHRLEGGYFIVPLTQ